MPVRSSKRAVRARRVTGSIFDVGAFVSTADEIKCNESEDAVLALIAPDDEWSTLSLCRRRFRRECVP